MERGETKSCNIFVIIGPKKPAGFDCNACGKHFKHRDKFMNHPCTKQADKCGDGPDYVIYTLKPNDHPFVKILKQKSQKPRDLYQGLFREKWAVAGEWKLFSNVLIGPNVIHTFLYCLKTLHYVKIRMKKQNTIGITWDINTCLFAYRKLLNKHWTNGGIFSRDEIS